MGVAAPERYATLVLFWELFAVIGGALVVVSIWRLDCRKEA